MEEAIKGTYQSKNPLEVLPVLCHTLSLNNIWRALTPFILLNKKGG
jgi:hypothetical protein